MSSFRLDMKCETIKFACVLVLFRLINGTVKSAQFFQLSNLIKSRWIVSPKIPSEIEKKYSTPPKSQICGQLFFFSTWLTNGLLLT